MKIKAIVEFELSFKDLGDTRLDNITKREFIETFAMDCVIAAPELNEAYNELCAKREQGKSVDFRLEERAGGLISKVKRVGKIKYTVKR